MVNNKFIISLIGLPGCGKGTQGRMLAQNKDFIYLSVGDLVKRIFRFHKKDNLVDKNLFLKGIPQPDEKIKDILDFELGRIKSEFSLILDQFPLNKNQIKLLEIFKEKYEFNDYLIVYFDVPEEKLLTRLLERKTCSLCSKTYSGSDINYKTGICSCGGKLIVREDDQKNVILRRFILNKKELETITKNKNNKHLVFVNGDQEIDLVQADLIKVINDYLKI